MTTDIHTHTKFSPDGVDDIYTMLAAAKAAGVKYYGISEHFDFDLNECAPAEEYFPAARSLKEREKDINILVGAELGYADDISVIRRYSALIEKFEPDFIVNSVHSLNAEDYYYGAAYVGRNKKDVYEEYFSTVLKSLTPWYRYDVIGHLGYCSRYAPYAEKKIIYSDFSYALDKILSGIISRDKILEVNSSAAGSGGAFLPDRDILERYFLLGGRNISFASDAHKKEKICFNRPAAIKMLKEIGFSYVTVPLSATSRLRVEI